MHRSMIPFLLVCFGFTVIMLARDMPLFDWGIGDVEDSIPNSHVNPSVLTTRLGESVSEVCNPVDTESIPRLSQNGELLERISANFSQKVFPWLWSVSWLLLFLSGMYTWWF